MYKHILIETVNNTLDFFNVKQFDYDEDLKVYKLLSQNNEWHFFHNPVRVII